MTTTEPLTDSKYATTSTTMKATGSLRKMPRTPCTGTSSALNGLSSKRQGCLRASMSSPYIVDDMMAMQLPEPGVEAVSDTELIVRTKELRCSVRSLLRLALDEHHARHLHQRPSMRAVSWRDVDFTRGEVIGTGPFILKVFEDNNRAELERNPNYFLSEYPYMDGYSVLAIPDANTRVAAFMAGQVDYLGLFGDAPSPRDVERIVARLGEDAVRQPRVNANGWRGFPLNTHEAAVRPGGRPHRRQASHRHSVDGGPQRVQPARLQRHGPPVNAVLHRLGLDPHRRRVAGCSTRALIPRPT